MIRRHFLLLLAFVASAHAQLSVSPQAAPLMGLWAMRDSGAVIEFRADGTVLGWPARGTWKLTEGDRLLFTSQNEVLNCAWKKNEDGSISLTREVEGKAQETFLVPLKPAKLRLETMAGPWFILHLKAGDKTASGRAVRLESTGHFRSKEGGYYFRMLNNREGQPVAYASGDEDKTRPISVFGAGPLLVIYDKLDQPSIFASCLQATP